jgi:hypothetical protein
LLGGFGKKEDNDDDDDDKPRPFFPLLRETERPLNEGEDGDGNADAPSPFLLLGETEPAPRGDDDGE